MSDKSGSAGSGPLAGIRVIDLATVVMGPYAAGIFADLGADVIKVESPSGDPIRHAHPQREAALSAPEMALNRNKRSLALDLKSERGNQAMLELVDTADVLITTMRPGALHRLGLDHEHVRERNPKLVYCNAQGFRTDSEQADNAAYDEIVQASSGLVDPRHRVSQLRADRARRQGLRADHRLLRAGGAMAAQQHRVRAAGGSADGRHDAGVQPRRTPRRAHLRVAGRRRRSGSLPGEGARGGRHQGRPGGDPALLRYPGRAVLPRRGPPRPGRGSAVRHRAGAGGEPVRAVRAHRRTRRDPRESPLSEVHLDNMLALSRMGATILPPMPAFYNQPSSVDDIVDHVVARALDQFDIDTGGTRRWQGVSTARDGRAPQTTGSRAGQ